MYTSIYTKVKSFFPFTFIADISFPNEDWRYTGGTLEVFGKDIKSMIITRFIQLYSKWPKIGIIWLKVNRVEPSNFGNFLRIWVRTFKICDGNGPKSKIILIWPKLTNLLHSLRMELPF